MPDRPKAAIIVGHRPSAQGAVSLGGVSEYAYNEPLARMVAAGVTGIDPRIVYRPDHKRGYFAVPGRVNKTDADFALSLHFNSVVDPRANGLEVLYWHASENGKRLAEIVVRHVVDALGTSKRHGDGLLPITSTKQRGGPLLYYTALPCVVVEPGFGSNAGDWAALRDRKAHYATVLRAAIEEYAGTL